MAGALRFRCGEDLSLGLRIAYAGVEPYFARVRCVSWLDAMDFGGLVEDDPGIFAEIRQFIEKRSIASRRFAARRSLAACQDWQAGRSIGR